MRAPLIAILATTVAACALGAGAARADDHFRRMEFVSLGDPGPVASRLADLWADEIRSNEARNASNRNLFRGRDGRLPVTFQYAAFDLGGGRSALVSVIFDASSCTNGANSATSQDVQSQCVGKATVGDGGRSVDLPGACFMRVDDQWTPGLDPARNGAWASFDAQTRVAKTVAVFDARPIPTCSKSVTVP